MAPRHGLTTVLFDAHQCDAQHALVTRYQLPKAMTASSIMAQADWQLTSRHPAGYRHAATRRSRSAPL
jgi:hypothetical protein